ncbi:MAG: large conductance mechanosensitive channel protein MscL [Myxococcaceae bacterium]|nr:large conductance mechanosensitive channel protein MscL [Myxococcaceae bacterium]
MLKGFRDFLIRGNVVDLAVAVIIGAAFGEVVGAFTKAVLDPLMMMIGDPTKGQDLGLLNIPLRHDETGKVLVSMNFNLIVSALVNFVLKAAVIYFLIVTPVRKLVEGMKKEEAAKPPPEPPAQEKLLTEIRDLLKARG